MPYEVHVFDYDGTFVSKVTHICLNQSFDLFSHQDNLKEKFAHPFVVPNSAQLFFPAGILMLVKREDGGVWFTQDGAELFSVEGEIIRLNLSASRVIEAESILHTRLVDLALDKRFSALLHIIINYDSGRRETIHFSGLNSYWKSIVEKSIPIFKVFWAPLCNQGSDSEKDAAIIPFQIFFTIDQAEEFFPSANFAAGDDDDDDEMFFVYGVSPDDPTTLKRIPVQTFMAWKVADVTAPVIAARQAPSKPLEMRDPFGKFEKLEDSFKHLLSDAGQDTLSVLKVEIFERYLDWTAPEPKIIAPIASLSQGSGSGKSKLAVEVVQDGPGFYLVTRPDDTPTQTVTGYPRNNLFSTHLKDLAREDDDIFQSYINVPYNCCQSGKILFFFAKIITASIRDLHSRVAFSLQNNVPFDYEIDLVRAASFAIGKLFEKNDLIDCNAILKDFALDEHIANKILTFQAASDRGLVHNFVPDPASDGRSVPTVNGIATYIKSILDNPSEALVHEHCADASKLISHCLNLFPFIFVLDEAELLLDIPVKIVLTDDYQKMSISGFDVVRRALSYLIPQTKLFFLTLGTRSDVLDLNPPLRENSARLVNRQALPKPILLLSNTCTFAKTEFPIEYLKIINHNVLRNPVLFKLMVTLGHPLWSSRQFDEIAGLAETKLLNGSKESFDYVLCLWMIRAGIAANPLDLSTRSLIASHMVTLFDLDEQLVRTIVFYPSDPILALGCRNLIKALPVDKERLFSMLEQFFELSQIDRRSMADCIGSMIVLRAIDEGMNAASNCNSDTITAQIDAMIESNPLLENLWRKKRSILEPRKDTNNDAIPFTSNFIGYHVVTVENFLKEMLSESRFNLIKQSLPLRPLKDS